MYIKFLNGRGPVGLAKVTSPTRPKTLVFVLSLEILHEGNYGFHLLQFHPRSSSSSGRAQGFQLMRQASVELLPALVLVPHGLPVLGELNLPRAPLLHLGVCKHAYIHIHIHTGVHTHICTYVSIHIHTYVYTYVHVCIYIYTYTYINIYTKLHIQTYACIYIHCMCMCVYVHRSKNLASCIHMQICCIYMHM